MGNQAFFFLFLFLKPTFQDPLGTSSRCFVRGPLQVCVLFHLLAPYLRRPFPVVEHLLPIKINTFNLTHG